MIEEGVIGRKEMKKNFKEYKPKRLWDIIKTLALKKIPTELVAEEDPQGNLATVARVQINSELFEKLLQAFENTEIDSQYKDEEKYKYDFSYCDFLEDVDFKGKNFAGKVNFSHTKFKDIASFEDVYFESDALFKGVIFESIVNFLNVWFSGNTDFGYTEFRANADFESSTFVCGVYISGAKFEGNAYFRNTQFFNGENTDALSDFSKTSFQDTVDFMHAEFKYADFQEAVFKEQANFMWVKIDTLKLTGVYTKASMYFLWSKIDNTDRETARIIKHEFYKLDNSIEAMKWNTNELEAYRKELSKKGNLMFQKFVLFFQRITTNGLQRFVLFFQRITTNHATNWLLGILWILLGNATILLIFLGILYWWKDIPFPTGNTFFYILANFINPIHNINVFESLCVTSDYLDNTNNLSCLTNIRGIIASFDMIFRVLNISLIYLTVSAFRRLSKTK